MQGPGAPYDVVLEQVRVGCTIYFYIFYNNIKDLSVSGGCILIILYFLCYNKSNAADEWWVYRLFYIFML